MTEEKTEAKSSKGVSRREFIAGTVGGVVVGAVVGAAAGSLGFPTIPASVSQPWLPAKWDYTADVVILGTGFAGLAAALTAHQAGATVIVLEKMPKALQGGNSIVAGNEVWAPLDVTQGATYISACNMGRVSDSSIPTLIAQGLQQNLTWIANLGVTLGLSTIGPANPGVVGASTVKFYVPSYNGVQHSGGAGIWYPLRQTLAPLEGSNLQFMYQTPATGLVQNADTKEILGVKALSGATVASDGTYTGGTAINVKASKAVILACGGFEYNDEMLAQYLPAPKGAIAKWGSPGNTGDGIMMAMAAGADLWHMQQQNMGVPDAIRTPHGDAIGSVKGTNYIYVDRTGKRYVNESTGFGSYGYPGWEISMYFDRTNEDFLRDPCWVVFDETARKAGPFVAPAVTPPGGFPSGINGSDWFGNFSGYTWSSDNSAEISSGWILKADSVADLSSAMAADPDSTSSSTGQVLMSSANLSAAVSQFNTDCTAGKGDTVFGRSNSTMASISTPPFYAAKLWPGMNNTEGGPRRNPNCQVLDTTGAPIPRLYSAGELGSFYGMLYNGGGNIGECLLTGRIAANSAVAETPWS